MPAAPKTWIFVAGAGVAQHELPEHTIICFCHAPAPARPRPCCVGATGWRRRPRDACPVHWPTTGPKPRCAVTAAVPRGGGGVKRDIRGRAAKRPTTFCCWGRYGSENRPQNRPRPCGNALQKDTLRSDVLPKPRSPLAAPLHTSRSLLPRELALAGRRLRNTYVLLGGRG